MFSLGNTRTCQESTRKSSSIISMSIQSAKQCSRGKEYLHLNAIRQWQKRLKKILGASFIREVFYPDWLASMVMVKKNNGKWRMCVDIMDLNKACPKDSFPLRTIN